MSTVEETKGGKHAHGTHDYPDPLTHIDRVSWDVVIVGAGPAGLMLAVRRAYFSIHNAYPKINRPLWLDSAATKCSLLMNDLSPRQQVELMEFSQE